MRIALAQINPIVGDLAGNADKIIAYATQASGARLVLFPELALLGYPPEDLLLRPSLYQDQEKQLNRLADASKRLRIALVVGHACCVEEHRFNAVTVYDNGLIIAHYRKQMLPNYDVFDEARYFTPGTAPTVFTLDGICFGLNICEDIWHAAPPRQARAAGATVLLVLNASPYHQEKAPIRLALARTRIRETGLAMVYVNQVGGQDELVFDGGSFAVNIDGTVVTQLPLFTPAVGLIEIDEGGLHGELGPAWASGDAALYQALVTGIQDYVAKNAFPSVLLGLSGGVDSALTLVLAVDALGADRVHALMAPSNYTASISLEDARTLIARTGCPYQEMDIRPLMDAFQSTLATAFTGRAVDTTEENLQARIRGTLLMALSNKFGHLVLTTGNKSEFATGYCTLYGDMAGGFAVLKDISKTTVYRLCRYRNQINPLIPERILTRPPSAELRDNQTDQDSLPPYEILDDILLRAVEQNASAEALIEAGFAAVDVHLTLKRLYQNEFKRQQAPVGIRVTPRGFGKDWRMPIINHYAG